jgi:hypothetical protein
MSVAEIQHAVDAGSPLRPSGVDILGGDATMSVQMTFLDRDPALASLDLVEDVSYGAARPTTRARTQRFATNRPAFV